MRSECTQVGTNKNASNSLISLQNVMFSRSKVGIEETIKDTYSIWILHSMNENAFVGLRSVGLRAFFGLYKSSQGIQNIDNLGAGLSPTHIV
jgi:hypothetical protein